MFAACSKMLEWIRERVPHRRCGYTETPFAQFCSCSRDHKIATLRWMQVDSSRGCSHRSTNVTEIGRADAGNTVPSQYGLRISVNLSNHYCYIFGTFGVYKIKIYLSIYGDFVSDSVLYREPVEPLWSHHWSHKGSQGATELPRTNYS